MSDIVLSAGVRQNLLALQNTAQLMSVTQNRLATGKRVNSALDNPFNFFTSQSLSNRARDLNGLLDSIGQAQQMIASADNGISAITKLVESAKSIAKQAQQTTETATYNLGITGTIAIADDVEASGTSGNAIAADTQARITGSVTTIGGVTINGAVDTLDELGIADGDQISVFDGTNTTTYTVGTASTTTINTMTAALSAGTANVTVAVSGSGAITVTADLNTDSVEISSTGDLDGAGFDTGNTSADPTNATLAALTGLLTVTQGTGTPVTVDFDSANAPQNRAELLAALNVQGNIATIDVGGNLVLTATNITDAITVSATGNAMTDLDLEAIYKPTNPAIDALDGTLTVQLGSGTVQTINFTNSALGEITNRADLLAALENLVGVTATIDDGTGFIEINSTSSQSVTIGGTVASSFFDPTAIGAHEPTVTLGAPNATRQTLELQYNDLLSDIDDLAHDSHYNGVNLLNGDELKVVFNEDGSSFLTVTGVTFTAAGLGLTAATTGDFQTNAGVQTYLTAIDGALSTLRAQAASFGSKLGTVQTRQDFTNKLIQTLEIGADNLVLADANEEGANMLALQTRQQLSTTALSLSAQADQAVLRLFG
jgi:flagellin